MKTSGATQSNTPNSTPRIAELTVEAMKLYQDLGRDIEALREHLRSPIPGQDGSARIAACQLTALTLGQTLTQMLILKLSDQQ